MNATLLAALMTVESNNNPNAIGDHGRAIGVLQISRAVVRDVNRATGSHYRWPADCYNKATSIAICSAYLDMYARGKSAESMARVWNGGPGGDRKASTLAYWRLVKPLLL
jgi:soluble lytic murein transglycosylase-like protein